MVQQAGIFIHLPCDFDYIRVYEQAHRIHRRVPIGLSIVAGCERIAGIGIGGETQ